MGCWLLFRQGWFWERSLVNWVGRKEPQAQELTGGNPLNVSCRMLNGYHQAKRTLHNMQEKYKARDQVRWSGGRVRGFNSCVPRPWKRKLTLKFWKRNKQKMMRYFQYTEFFIVLLVCRKSWLRRKTCKFLAFWMDYNNFYCLMHWEQSRCQIRRKKGTYLYPSG